MIKNQKDPKNNNKKCFITTATLINIGDNNDKCYELEVFRRFRDSYIQQNFPELINYYHEIAPQIVKTIEVLPTKSNITRFGVMTFIVV